MSGKEDKVDLTVDRRAEGREPFHGQVTMRLEPGEVAGVGQDLTSEGVLFVTGDTVSVQVWVEGRDEPLQGELIRVQQMEAGRLGIAVRFDQP